jgi:hypothetical protein
VFTARYALSSYIKQIRFVFKGLKIEGRKVKKGPTCLIWKEEDKLLFRARDRAYLLSLGVSKRALSGLLILAPSCNEESYIPVAFFIVYPSAVTF